MPRDHEKTEDLAFNELIDTKKDPSHVRTSVDLHNTYQKTCGNAILILSQRTLIQIWRTFGTDENERMFKFTLF